MNRKVRKKKWTTKNTHLQKPKHDPKREKKDWWFIIFDWIIIITAILSILVIASNNHVVGYDHYIGIPREWIKSLFK